MKKLLLTTTLLVSFALPAMAEGVSGNLTFTSDYVFRGVSQSDEKAALQGGFDYEHETGLHAGVWGSNIDFNNPQDGSLELDIYAGFANEVGAISYDVGGIYYAYPGAENSLNYNFWEVYANAGYDFDMFSVNAGANYSPEFFGKAGDALYYYAGVDVPLPYEVGLSAHIGQQDIDEATDYSDWSVGLSKNWMEFDWGVTYTDTNLDAGKTDDGRVVFSVGKTF